jgi:tripartite motif-containing protein 71
VADFFNHRIQIFSPTGEFIRSIGRKGSEKGCFVMPIGVCAMDGNIVVSDSGNDRIQIVSPTGAFIRTF